MPSDPKHLLRVTVAPTNDSGRAYSYRGAVILLNKQETNCSSVWKGSYTAGRGAEAGARECL
jgi:hypothetical protein